MRDDKRLETVVMGVVCEAGWWMNDEIALSGDGLHRLRPAECFACLYHRNVPDKV